MNDVIGFALQIDQPVRLLRRTTCECKGPRAAHYGTTISHKNTLSEKICDLAANLRERFSCCGNSSRESGTTPACPARLAGVG